MRIYGKEDMNQERVYNKFKKPTWAPPSWLFGPVWTVLYIIIFISFSYTFLEIVEENMPFWIIIPLLLNLLFNFLFTYIQFTLKNNILASVDIVLVWVTIVILMAAVYPYIPWVTYAMIPYFLWVSFASILQFNVTYLNK